MLSAIAIVPSAPVMVPELAAGAAAELADLREAVFAAAASLPPRWIAVGVGPADAVVGPDQAGTFAGYGVDVPSRCRPGPRRRARRELPLCALITGWVRGQAKPRRSAPRCGCTPTTTASTRRWRAAGGCAPRSTRPPIRSACSSSPTARTPSPRLRPAATTRTRSRCRPRSTTRSPRGDAAALTRLPDAHRRPGRLPGAGRADRTGAAVGQGALSRRALRRRLLRRRLAAMSRPDRDHRPDRHREVGAGAGGGRSAVGGEIVNADAMQLYRGMDIGTAKLPVAERRGIPHHQLDVLDVTETATVARYQQAAAADIEAIAGRGAVPIVVGGSMMYIQSLLDEWSFPATDPAVRAKWERRLAEVGVARSARGAGPGRRRRRRRRSCPPTAAASCGRWRSSS